jgi:predicted RNase H-like nuclease (RuvC/YqgF family)
MAHLPPAQPRGAPPLGPDFGDDPRRLEAVLTTIHADARAASAAVAREIAGLIRERAAEGKKARSVRARGRRARRLQARMQAAGARAAALPRKSSWRSEGAGLTVDLLLMEAVGRAPILAHTQAVLGLATGSTPLTLYGELIRLHTEEGLSFANVVSFNLDE